MENKKGLSFPFTIIAIILGITLFKQFDFKNLTFKEPAMAVVYVIGFAIAVFGMFKSTRNRAE